MKAKDIFLDGIKEKINSIKKEGLYKKENVITSNQDASITTDDKDVICLCANNYLGLANNKDITKEAIKTLEKGLYGMASVRFICGTQQLHKKLEKEISEFLGFEDTILYSSCFDANTGLFETLLDSNDAIISDSLNHASIIDGVRLCKAKRYRYNNNDMFDLEEKLISARKENAKNIMIATDGVFSMDGYIANLKSICDLADKYDALVMVDDSHAVGFLGKNGKGSHEYCDVMGRVDIMTGTLGKALGGASGGYTCAKKEVIDFLRQKSRPYLFSNTLAPSIVSASLEVLKIIKNGAELRKKLWDNTSFFRSEMEKLGFELLKGEHAIVPVMIGDASMASKFANEMLKRNVYVIGFSYPVVPMGKARIRTQMNANLTKDQIIRVVNCFKEVGNELGII